MSDTNTEEEAISWKSSRTFTSTWCEKLVTNLEKSFRSLGNSITEVKSDIQDIKETLRQSVEDALNVAKEVKEVKDYIEVHESAIADLRTEVNTLKSICSNLKKDNVSLKQQNSNFETYSRKDNLIIYGISEPNNENNTSCAQAVRLFLKNNLNISEEQVNSIEFVRCHRLREKKFGIRPIIVRFWRYSDRELVWSKVTTLKGQRSLSMSEDFPLDGTSFIPSSGKRNSYQTWKRRFS